MRDISFEEIITAIDNDQVLTAFKHPNQTRYPNQDIYVVHINDYVYLVPFVKNNNNDIFLKTIIPSRKARKKYLQKSMRTTYEENKKK